MNGREDGRHEPGTGADREVAPRYGAYASFATPNDPFLTRFHGDAPAREFDRRWLTR